MTPHDFIAKWRNGGDERRDAQPFFEDLYLLAGHPTPREADLDHTWFSYEFGAAITNGGALHLGELVRQSRTSCCPPKHSPSQTTRKVNFPREATIRNSNALFWQSFG